MAVLLAMALGSRCWLSLIHNPTNWPWISVEVWERDGKAWTDLAMARCLLKGERMYMVHCMSCIIYIFN